MYSTFEKPIRNYILGLIFFLSIAFCSAGVATASGCAGDCLLPRFTLAGTMSTGLPQYHLTSGDFNEDGHVDLILSGGRTQFKDMELSERYYGPAYLMLGNGFGAFGEPSQIMQITGGSATGDFNEDGHLDLVLRAEILEANEGISTWLLYGNGDGSFSAPLKLTQLVESGSQAFYTWYIVKDFNNDGHLDLAATAGPSAPLVQVLWGNGTSFDTSPYVTPDNNQIYWWKASLAVGDFYPDGRPDIYHTIWSWWPDDNTLLFYNLIGYGDETVTFWGKILSPMSCTSLAAADFNADGIDDLVASTAPGNFDGLGDKVQLFPVRYDAQLDDIEFLPGNAYSGGSWEVRAGDVNGDGKADVTTLKGVMTGNGDGTLNPLELFPLSQARLNNAVNMLQADINGDNKLDVVLLHSDAAISVLLNSTEQSPTGTDIDISIGDANFVFEEITAGGTTTVTPIDPASIGDVPGGFAVSDSVAYEIGTTATFTGSVTLAFKVPGPISQEDFNNLAILHNENGTLVDVTAATPARDYSTLTIYATTTSFSPFYLARRGSHIKSLFHQTKAYKRGSTIPIKLQMLNASNANMSSSSTSLVTRDLRLMSGNTMAPVEDAGNANPDYTFRYDSTLGGTGGGYIFNLSTKGLASGQYVLSFYVGAERSFFYTVKFEVK